MSTETRLDSVERQVELMAIRLRRLEQGDSGASPGEPTPPPTPAQSSCFDAPLPAYAPPSRPSASIPTIDFEEVFGGRVLAWVGGLAILLGALLFLGMAISHGWIDEATRTVLAFIGSTALLLAGVWLHERQGRTEAARAAVASALAGLFATLVVATQAYDLISTPVGLGVAALVAGAGMALAVRWSSLVIATIGAIGALAAPLLVGSGGEGASIAFVAVALAGTVGIVLWRRWEWLALCAFLVSAPQLIAWSVDNGDHRPGLVLPVLVGFWALYMVAALGFELRTESSRELPVDTWLLLFAAAGLVVGTGYLILQTGDHHDAAVAWVLGLAAVYVLIGDVVLRKGFQREIGALLTAVGLGASAIGLALALDGPALVAAWAVEAVALTFISVQLSDGGERGVESSDLVLFAAGCFGLLAFAHAIVFEAPPKALVEGVPALGEALAGIAVCAGAGAGAAFLLHRRAPLLAKAAGFAAAGALVYLGSVAIVDKLGVDQAGEVVQAGQVWLSAFWAAAGLGALVLGLTKRWSSVRIGGLALLSIAIGKVWTYDLSELDEVARVLSFIGLGLLLLAGAFAYQRLRPGAEGR